ncbi:MAG: hypothetical protein RKE49_01480 [Oceanicaulis sp.]
MLAAARAKIDSDPAAAAAALEMVCAAAPTRAGPWISLLSAYLACDHADLAAEAGDRAMSACPDAARITELRAAAARRLGDEATEARLLTGLHEKHGELEAAVRLAEIAMTRADAASARRLLAPLAARPSPRFALAYRAAHLLQSMGEDEQAVDCLAAVLAPSKLERLPLAERHAALRIAAPAFARLGRLENAREALMQLDEASPAFASALANLNRDDPRRRAAVLSDAEIETRLREGRPNYQLYAHYTETLRAHAPAERIYQIDQSFADNCRARGFSLLCDDVVHFSDTEPDADDAAQAFWRKLGVDPAGFAARLVQLRENRRRFQAVALANLPSSQPVDDFYRELDAVCEPPDLSLLEACAARDRGCCIVTSHASFWHLTAPYIERRFDNVVGVYGWRYFRKTARNPDIILRADPKEGLRAMKAHLSGSGFLMTAPDGVGAEPEPIIDTPYGVMPLATATPRAIHAAGAASVWVNVAYEDGRYRFVIKRLCDPKPGEPKQAFIRRWGREFYNLTFEAMRTRFVCGVPRFVQVSGGVEVLRASEGGPG